MRTQELLKLLHKNKCHVLRNGSRHDIWDSEITGKQFPVPRHKAEIPNGTLNGILKEAGLKWEEKNMAKYVYPAVFTPEEKRIFN